MGWSNIAATSGNEYVHYGVVVGSALVIPPIVVSEGEECWFYRCAADALEAGIPAGAKVFEGTGRRLEASGGGLTLVTPGGSSDELMAILSEWLKANDAIRWSIADWPLSLLLRCAIEQRGWSDRASVRRTRLHHWLIFVPRNVFHFAQSQVQVRAGDR